MSKHTFTYTCHMCAAIKVEMWDLVIGLDRVPYCDYCVIPMARYYGTTTA
jgi:hypothetical protein